MPLGANTAAHYLPSLSVVWTFMLFAFRIFAIKSRRVIVFLLGAASYSLRQRQRQRQRQRTRTVTGFARDQVLG